MRIRELRAVRSFIDMLDRVLGLGVLVQSDVPAPATVVGWRRLASSHDPLPPRTRPPRSAGREARDRWEEGEDTPSLPAEAGGRTLPEEDAGSDRA